MFPNILVFSRHTKFATNDLIYRTLFYPDTKVDVVDEQRGVHVAHGDGATGEVAVGLLAELDVDLDLVILHLITSYYYEE